MLSMNQVHSNADNEIALLNLPRCEFDMAREQRLHYWDVSKAQLHLPMDPKLFGDECIEAGDGRSPEQCMITNFEGGDGEE